MKDYHKDTKAQRKNDFKKKKKITVKAAKGHFSTFIPLGVFVPWW